MRTGILIFVFFIALHARANEPTPTQVQALAQDILLHTAEFQDLQQRAGSAIFVQNKTSAELVEFVRERVRRQGGVDALAREVREFRIRLGDWHRIGAPLDISAPTAAPANVERLSQASGTSSFRGVKINRPSSVETPAYEVQFGSSTTRGAEKLSAALSPSPPMHFSEEVLTGRNPAATLRAYAETVDFLADHPGVRLNGPSQAQVDRLFATVKTHPERYTPLLHEGNTFTGIARNESEEIVGVLERVQLGSRGTIPASAGLEGLLSSAGGSVSDYRRQTIARFDPSRPLTAEGIRVLHGTSEAGAQNIQRGQFAFSGGLNLIDGQMSGVAEGQGIYTVGPGATPPYANRLVEMELDPACLAKKTCEFDEARNWYRITKPEAIRAARVVPREEYFDRLLTAAKAAPKSVRFELLEKAAALLDPAADAGRFQQVMSEARAVGAERRLLASYLSAPGRLESVLGHPGASAFKTAVVDFIASEPNRAVGSEGVFRNLVTTDPELIRREPRLQAKLQSVVTDIVQGHIPVNSSDRELSASLARISPDAYRPVALRDLAHFDFDVGSVADRTLLEELRSGPVENIRAFFANMRPAALRFDNVEDADKFGARIAEMRFARLAHANPDLALDLFMRGSSLANANDRPAADIARYIQAESNRLSPASKQRLLALAVNSTDQAGRSVAVQILSGSRDPEIINGLKAAAARHPERTDLLRAVADQLSPTDLVSLAEKNRAVTGRIDESVLRQLIANKNNPNVAGYLEQHATTHPQILDHLTSLSANGIESLLERIRNPSTPAAERETIFRQLRGQISKENFSRLLSEEIGKPSGNRVRLSNVLGEEEITAELKQRIIHNLGQYNESEKLELLKYLKAKSSPQEFKSAVISFLESGDISLTQRNFLLQSGLSTDADILHLLQRRIAAGDRILASSVAALLEPSPELSRAIIAESRTKNPTDDVIAYLKRDSRFRGQARLRELGQTLGADSYQRVSVQNAVREIERAGGSAAQPAAGSGRLRCILNNMIHR